MLTERGQPVLRCASYTRHSVSRADEDFTSCEAQRERCEDYVRAMQYEGWTAIAERFDDLGESGGGLERPALRRLLSWRVRGRVDVVVVTRLDRLTRSSTSPSSPARGPISGSVRTSAGPMTSNPFLVWKSLASSPVRALLPQGRDRDGDAVTRMRRERERAASR